MNVFNTSIISPPPPVAKRYHHQWRNATSILYTLDLIVICCSYINLKTQIKTKKRTGETMSSKGYIKLPRELLSVRLSSSAKIIYAMMLSRSDWIDSTNKDLDLLYTLSELSNKLSISRKAVIRAIKELEQTRLIMVCKTVGLPNTYEPQPLSHYKEAKQ